MSQEIEALLIRIDVITILERIAIFPKGKVLFVHYNPVSKSFVGHLEDTAIERDIDAGRSLSLIVGTYDKNAREADILEDMDYVMNQLSPEGDLNA